MFAAHNLRHRLEKLELALVAKSEPPEIQFSYRVHTAQQLDNLQVTECADADASASLVLDYVAVLQGDEWRLSGEARQRPTSGPDDQGKIITNEGMQVGELVRDLVDGVIEMIVNADDSEWEPSDIIWGGC